MSTNDDAIEWTDMKPLVELLQECAAAAHTEKPAHNPGRIPARAATIARPAQPLRGDMPLDELQLHETRLAFPHVIAQLADNWYSPRRFAALLDELTLLNRPHRSGFPFAVLNELTNLRMYYFGVLHPEFRERLHQRRR